MVRLSSQDVPTAYAYELEAATIVQPEQVTKLACRVHRVLRCQVAAKRHRLPRTQPPKQTHDRSPLSRFADGDAGTWVQVIEAVQRVVGVAVPA